MTGHALPQRLWRPLAEVKNFMEKQPESVTLTTMSTKVKTFGALSRKDKALLIDHFDSRDMVHVFQARALTGKTPTTFFLHKKFNIPKAIPGYLTPSPTGKFKIIPSEELEAPKEFKLSKVSSATDIKPVEPQPEPVPAETVIEQIPSAAEGSTEIDVDLEKEIIEASAPPKGECDPDELRRRALEMLMEAETATQKRVASILSDEVRPKLDSFIERFNKANDAIQSTLDGLYDQMGELDKVTLEFKAFAASLK